MSNQWNPNMSPYRQDRSSCMPVLLIIFVLTLGIGGGIYFFVNNVMSEAFESSITQVSSQMETAVGGSTANEPAIAGSVLYHSTQLAYDRNGDERNELLVQLSNNSQYSMALLDGADGKPVWQTELGSESYDLIALDSYVAVIKERDFRLFNSQDGTFGWQTRLTDRIQTNPPMLFIVDDLLVIQTYDNILTAYELKTGSQRWQKTLVDRYASNLARLGDELCGTERDAESGLEFLTCYALKTGEQRQALQLNNDWTDDVEWVADPQTKEGILRLQSDPEPITLSAIGIDQSQRWSIELEEVFADSLDYNKIPVSDGKSLVLSTESALAIISAEHQIVRYTLADYALTPLGFDNDVLYVSAVKQRGTNTVSILAINAQTAELIWRLDDLGESHEWSGSDGIKAVIVPGEGVVFGWLDPEIDDLVRVQLLKRQDGTVGWSFQQQMFIGQVPKLTRTGNALLIQTSDGLAMANLRTGESLWTLTR
ncbi:MAG: PQQ-binding-like beta-propeller repeat protein [Chloroflexi bacterium]|nr:PQQ-binding-like beta-propeller repeat protein [Chloroflexota bacterium]